MYVLAFGVLLAPADVVEGVGGVEAEGGPDAVGDEAVDPGALVDLVEVGEGLAGVEFGLGAFGVDGGAVGVVEEAFDEVGGGGHVFEALLVLDADGVAAEVGGDSCGGDVHLALVEDLIDGELGGGVEAELEVDAAIEEPLVDGLGFFVA